MAHVHTPGPDDFAFNYDKIKNGYAAIAFMLNGQRPIRSALATYQALADTPLVIDECLPENAVERLRGSINSLRHAAHAWSNDKPKVNFQRDYANLAKMAYDDCAIPLATIEEAANVLDRACTLQEGARAVAKLSVQDIQASYDVLDRLRRLVRGFANDLWTISTTGAMVVGASSKTDLSGQLARPIRSKAENDYFRQEALFWGIVGVLSAEKDAIIAALSTIHPATESERLTQDFGRVAERVSAYAKFAIEEPARAITLLREEEGIPRCLQALEQASSRMDENQQGVMEMLKHCIRSLNEPSGPKEGMAK